MHIYTLMWPMRPIHVLHLRLYDDVNCLLAFTIDCVHPPNHLIILVKIGFEYLMILNVNKDRLYTVPLT